MKKIGTTLFQTTGIIIGLCLLAQGAFAQSNTSPNESIVLWSLQKQNTVTHHTNPRITINVTNVSLGHALKLIVNQVGDGLYYNAKLLPDKKITLHLKAVPLDKALKKVLTGTLLKAKISNQNITLQKRSNLAPEQKKVSGKVTSASNGNPLIGVNILVKGTNMGTTTDTKGHFSIAVPSLQDTLVFSYIGYKRSVIPINDRTKINIQMKPTTAALNKVVVVGYGTQKKRDLTGSVSSVKMKKAEVIPTTNVAEMLRGRVAGLKTTTIDPRPGGTSNILIRGRRSILGGNSPLFVVDGVPMKNINSINAEDIASIEVLKDASAEAIYGARGANGVILITTKRGTPGELRINYHGYYTIQKVTKNFELYSPKEFAQLRREAYRTTFGHYLKDSAIFSKFERESLKNNRFINWENLLLQNAKLTSHNLSVSGGNEKTQFYSSIRYFSQKGIVPTSGFKRGTFRLNLDQKLSDKINIQADVTLMTDKQNIESSTFHFISISPLAKAFKGDGSINKYPLGPNSTLINPLWNLKESANQAKNNSFSIHLVGNYQILKNLHYKLNTSFRQFNRNHNIYLTSKHGVGQYTNGKATVEHSRHKEYLIENILKYYFQIGEANQFAITAMQSVSQINYIHTQTIGTGFTSDLLGYNGLTGALHKLANRNGYRRRLLSFMGRVRYNLMNKYLFTLTGRSDGSSVFAENDKRGFFPSAAFAWKISAENFLKNNRFIDQLKLRLSYGSVGNEAIDPYQTLGIVNNYPYVFGGETAAGYMPGNRLPNPNLTWETSTTFNIGLDFALFRNRLSGTLEYYDTHTRNLLVDVSLPGNTGYSSIITNGGETRNHGFNATLRGDIFRNKDFNWSAALTFAANRNEILKTGLVDANGNPKDDIARNRFVGHPINVIYQKKFAGIFQSKEEIKNSAQKDQPNIVPGNIRVVDKNGDGKITDEDNFIFNTAPNWYGSFSTRLQFKGFDLMADLYFYEGATKLNPYLCVYSTGGTLQGALNGIKVPYYTPENPSKKWPIPESDQQPYLYALAVRNASYIRLRTLTLGYTFPSSLLDQIKIRKLRLYVTATNLFTITDYRSYSPEVNPGSYPESKAFTVGLNIGF